MYLVIFTLGVNILKTIVGYRFWRLLWWKIKILCSRKAKYHTNDEESFVIDEEEMEEVDVLTNKKKKKKLKKKKKKKKSI